MVTLVASVLVIAFGDSWKARLTGQMVTAKVYVSAWYPYPKGGETNVSHLMDVREDKYARPSETILRNDFPFAVMVVRNNGFSAANDVTIKLDGVLLSPSVLIVPGGKGEHHFIHEAKDIVIPELKPQETYKVYMWNPHDLREKYYWEDVRAFSSQGNISMSLVSSETMEIVRPDDFWFNFIDRYVYWVLLFVLSAFTILSLAGALYYNAYIAKLLKDQSFYMNEALRYEESPTRFEPRM
ncbi:hypothetical protein D3C85_483380 [compost metagenome]